MPFRSKKQRSFLKRTKVELYNEWKRKYGLGIKPKGGKNMKKKRQPTEWNKHLMKVYKEMKAKDKTVKFSDAMKKAKVSYNPKKK